MQMNKFRICLLMVLMLLTGITSMAQKKALIIVDIQTAYFPGGSSPLVKPEEAAAQAKKVLTLFREKQWPVIHVQHNSRAPGMLTYNGDDTGILVYPAVYPEIGETVITKAYPSSFLKTGLDSLLKSWDVNQLVVCGMMTHMCVDATVRAAKDLGYDITLIGNACATKDLKIDGEVISSENVHKSFLAALASYYAKVETADEFIKQQ